MSGPTAMLRATVRVLLRVLAKASAYGTVIGALVLVLDYARGADGRAMQAVAVFILACWTALACSVLRDKVHEEAQRIKKGPA